MPTSLSDGRITLRPWRREDAPSLLELARESAAEIGRWMEWTDLVTNIASAERYLDERQAQWDSGEAYCFCFEDAANRFLLGGCVLGQLNLRHRLANVGYFVRTGQRGRGYTGAAVRLLLRFGFEQLPLQRLEILVEPSNAASLRVAEKLGAVREGILRHRLCVRGQPYDAVLFSVLRAEVLGAADAQGSAT